MFVDASALCAILLKEPDRREIIAQILRSERPITSPVAAWETARAVIREQEATASQAVMDVDGLLANLAVEIKPIAAEHYRRAMNAFERFGKGRHPAALNMGDCFAYACAKASDRPLLYKGDDFSLTDVDAA